MMNTTKESGAIANASEAILRMEELEEGKVRVILADGWNHVLPQTIEEDPGCLIIWDDNNINATVAAFNNALTAAPSGSVPPVPALVEP